MRLKINLRRSHKPGDCGGRYDEAERLCAAPRAYHMTRKDCAHMHAHGSKGKCVGRRALGGKRLVLGSNTAICSEIFHR